MIRIFVSLAVIGILSISTSSAAVTLTFDSDVEGFTANTATSLLFSTEFGGSMMISMPGGSNTTDASLRAAVLNFSGTDAFATEMADAAALGGTLSFDFYFREADQVLTDPAAAPPSLVEAAIVTEGSFTDRSIGLVSYPDSGETSMRTISFNITAGTGWDFNATNPELIYEDDGTGSFAFGIKDSGTAFETATFFIDNLTVAAVPEPSSFAIFALGGVVIASRRRRRSKA